MERDGRAGQRGQHRVLARAAAKNEDLHGLSSRLNGLY
jgi:hypothetical protein